MLTGRNIYRFILAAMFSVVWSIPALAQVGLTPAQQQQLQLLLQQQSSAQSALNAAQTALNQQNAATSNAQRAYNTALTQQQTAANNLATAQASGTATAAQITALQTALTNANGAVTNTQQGLATALAQQQMAIANATTAQNAWQGTNSAYSDYYSSAMAGLLQAGNAAQNANVGGALAAGNFAQSAYLDAYNMAMNYQRDVTTFMNNAVMSSIRDGNTQANIGARQGFNAAYGASLQEAGGNGCQANTLGGMLCNIMATSTSGVGIISGFAYLCGLICGFMGILKLRQHVESPNQVEIWDPIKRFVAGGAFFLLPTIADVVRRTIEGDESSVSADTGFNGAASAGGLDAMVVALMSNIGVPAVWIVSWFGWIAGLIFVFIGISRLMQTEQQGPKGPTGIGTVTTFLIAGCLFSLNSIVTYLNGSVFNSNEITTNATLQYAENLGGASDHVHAVLSAIIMFSIVVGWISLVRGLFIIRGVSEGNSQASMMAAITHLIGGILAINLGAVIRATQTTLGITQYGLNLQ